MSELYTSTHSANPDYDNLLKLWKKMGHTVSRETLEDLRIMSEESPGKFKEYCNQWAYANDTYGGKSKAQDIAINFDKVRAQYEYNQSRKQKGLDPLDIRSLDWAPGKYDDAGNEALNAWYQENGYVPKGMQMYDFTEFKDKYAEKKVNRAAQAKKHLPKEEFMRKPLELVGQPEAAQEEARADNGAEAQPAQQPAENPDPSKEFNKYIFSISKPDVPTVKKKDGDVSVYGLIFNKSLLDDPQKVEAFLKYVHDGTLSQAGDFGKWVSDTFGLDMLGKLVNDPNSTAEKKKQGAKALLDLLGGPWGWAMRTFASPYTASGAFTQNFANGLTFGAVEQLNKNQNYNPMEVAKELHPVASGLGEAGGQVVPFAGLEAGTVKLLTKLSPTMLKSMPVLSGVIRGAAPAMAYTGIRDVAEGKSAEEVAADMLVNGSIGGMFGGAMGAMQRRAAINALAKELRSAAKEYRGVQAPPKAAALDTPVTVPTNTVGGKLTPDIQPSVPTKGNMPNPGDDVPLPGKEGKPGAKVEDTISTNESYTQANQIPENPEKSPSGLNWDKVVSKKGETRIDHVNKHSIPKPQRTTHGVFNGNPQDIVNQAWNNKGDIVPINDGMGGKIYNIPFENAGYESGSINTGSKMDYVTIIVIDGTEDIIAAFPSFGNYTK